MKKKIGLIFLLAVVATASYTQPYVTQDGFHYMDHYFFDLDDNGNLISGGFVEIFDYTGTSRSISIPHSLMGESPRIGMEAFFNKNLTSVTIPNGVTVIGQGAFHTNQLTSVTVPNSVTEIGIGAFMNNRLSSVTIGNNVTEIRQVTFALNPLTSITIGADVNIHEDAFVGHEDDGRLVPNNFVEFYNAQGRLAGTYTRPNANSSNWTRR